VHDQQTAIVRLAPPKVRRAPRAMLCLALCALFLDGSIAPACSGWSRAAPAVLTSWSPAWPPLR
jgi:hypothetical protein